MTSYWLGSPGHHVVNCGGGYRCPQWMLHFDSFEVGAQRRTPGGPRCSHRCGPRRGDMMGTTDWCQPFLAWTSSDHQHCWSLCPVILDEYFHVTVDIVAWLMRKSTSETETLFLTNNDWGFPGQFYPGKKKTFPGYISNNIISSQAT